MDHYLRGLLLAACLIPLAGQAETVSIPVGNQSTADQLPALPERGKLKSAVRGRLGEPLEQRAPVGDPPISAWRYDGFTVYFEYDHVVHSVVNHEPRNPTGDPSDNAGASGP